MEYMFPSSNNGTLIIPSNKEAPNHDHTLVSTQEEELPLFLQFPSPFLDDISTTPILTHHYTEATVAVPPPPPPPPKRVRKKRCAGKKDRHSKIRTAQGLRDRRMRLSLHIARKFFGLQDKLGFDKASKTIEWLFSKSQKAIREVMESRNSDNTSRSGSREHLESESFLSDCEVESSAEMKAAPEKGKNLKEKSFRKATESNPLARESREKARARARERTREKSKQLFGGNPSNHFENSQLGFSGNPNLHNHCVNHLFDHTQLGNMGSKTESHLGNITTASSSTYFSIFDYNKNLANPPGGWLNSSNPFLGLLGGWDSESLRMESNSFGIVSNIAPLTGIVHGQNPSSIIFPASNFPLFRPQNQG